MRRLPLLVVVLAFAPFLGGVQSCGKTAPETSGGQQPDAGNTTSTGGTETSDTTGEGEEAVPVVPVETTEQLAQRLFIEGLAFLSTTPPQVPFAVERFAQVTQYMPDWAEAHYNLGLARFEGGSAVQAIPALEQATRLDPKMDVAWLLLAESYTRQRRTGAARDAYDQCVTHVPENVECRLGQVRLAMEAGESPDRVIERIRDILRINSTSTGAYILLSQAYMRLGQTQLAKFSLDKAKHANSMADLSPTLHCNLGMIYREMGLQYDAIAEFEKALEIDPDHVQSLVNLANVRITNLDFEGALQLTQRAALRDPSHRPARLALGIAKRGTGDLDGAKAEFERLLNEDPNNTDALYSLAVMYGDDYRDHNKAIELYEELISRSPGIADDDPLHTYLEDARKNVERELKRQERERLRREREAQKAAEEAARAAEEEAAARAAAEEAARAAAEEAARVAEEAAATPEEEAAPEPMEDGSGTEVVEEEAPAPDTSGEEVSEEPAPAEDAGGGE